MDKHEIKQIEELVAMRAKFYYLNDDLWCDTALDSFRLVPGVGYVKQEEEIHLTPSSKQW